MFIYCPPTGLALHLLLHQSVSWPKDTLAFMSETFVPGLRYPSQAHELWALIAESFRGWEERVNEAAAAVGLSPVSAWALVQLDPDHPISQKELAARLHCNPSTVVDPTDRLEDAGLVIRKANPADRRINVLIATPKGKQVRAELIDRLFEPPEAFRRLPAKEQTRFRDVMLAAVTGTRPPPQRREPAAKPSSTSRTVGGKRP
jgi:DNA-binding MarR family transcriptional regulator